MNTKIVQFKDLEAWQNGHQLVMSIYKATKTFPREEVFGLTSQLRRAAVSVTSNIAEGFSRRTNKEKLQFYFTSRGSLEEIRNQIIIAHDLGYLSSEQYQQLELAIEKTIKPLFGLIKYINKST